MTDPIPPRVSVLLPVRDAAPTIGAAIASLRDQTFTAFEVVLIDDGSTDGSIEIAQATWHGTSGAPAPPPPTTPTRLPLRILSPGRVGLVAALQQGLDAARAPLIARMDADDLAHPERLERQVALLNARPDIAICSCLVECFHDGEGGGGGGSSGGDDGGNGNGDGGGGGNGNGDGGVAAVPYASARLPVPTLAGGYRRYEAWVNALIDDAAIRRARFVESPIPHPSVVFRREAIAAVGGYEDRGWPEDYDLWLRAAEAGLRFAKVEASLLRWRDAPARTSRVDPRYAPEAFLRAKAYYLARGPLRGCERLVIWGAGRTGRRLVRALAAHGLAPRALVDIDPRKIGQVREGTPVIAPADLAGYRDHLLLAAVGSLGAREQILTYATSLGWRDGHDLLAVA